MQNRFADQNILQSFVFILLLVFSSHQINSNKLLHRHNKNHTQIIPGNKQGMDNKLEPNINGPVNDFHHLSSPLSPSH